MLNRSILFLCALIASTALSSGCQQGKRTFHSYRVDTNAACLTGVPTQVMTLHQVRVQWRPGDSVQEFIDEQGRVGSLHPGGQSKVQATTYHEPTNSTNGDRVTTHFCRLPIVYSVDAVGTPFGTDEFALEFYDNGALKKAESKRDHQIDELVSSVSEAAENLVPSLERGTEASNPFEFYPPLPPHAQIIEILEISPIQ